MALPLPKIFWPLTIVAGVNDKIDFNVGAGPFAVAIAAGVYSSADALRAAVQTALTSLGHTFTVTVDATGHFIVTRGTTFNLLWGTGANAAASARSVLGFDAADVGSSTAVTAPHQHQNGWYAQDPVVDDTRDLAAYERAGQQALSGRFKGLQYAQRYTRLVKLGFLPAWKTWKSDESGHTNEALEHLFDDGWARLRLWPDATVEGTWADYALDDKTRKAFPRNRLSSGNPIYSLDLGLLKIA